MTPGGDENPWDVLGVPAGASEEEVRRAYERLSAALAPGSLALYSLAEIDEQRALQEKLGAAYLTLRRSFGWDAAGSGGPAGEPAGADVPHPVAPPAPDAEFTGAVLRQVREGLGLSLAELSQRTRIRPGQLASLEEERFAALPERVFVRGFVMAVARELRLDPERVWASYGVRWERGSGDR